MPYGSTGGFTGGSVGGGQKIEIPITANGMAVFTLPDYPADGISKFWIEVNGAAYHGPNAFTLSGLTLTWGGAFKLATTDTLFACYF